MQSLRGQLIYTLVATVVFTVVQYMQDVTEPVALAFTAGMFFLFTFFMLRLLTRVLTLMLGGARKRRAEREEAEKGPAVTEPTTTRPDHVRRRRARARRRR